MSGVKCAQPGCAGTILDGYCDVCGSPEPAAQSAGSTTAGVARRPAPGAAANVVPEGGRCGQPGCTGTIVDGYCDVCGTPGTAGASEDSQATQMAGMGGVSTMSRASNRLASTALGSALASQSGTSITRRGGTGSTRLRGARLGAGLTSIPSAPPVDAATAIMEDPQVEESKRTCPACGSAVGRSRDGQPGRTEGFCPKCRNPYSFTPKLRAGDLVAGQYEVAGCLAHGGLGWIYLARDKNVSDRWVVLKGLLNSGDKDALEAAIAEQRFLAQVEHPLIVEIYNFVTHEEAGYIVMEYVGGTSLKSLLKSRMKANNGVYDPLPVDQAVAFIIEALPAFQYLHDLGLVYCDFKPDNMIQVGDAIKLIDLGGVRRIDDQTSAIYGTVGYQAPEVPTAGPSVASDIFTIGRTLVVLAMEFRGYQSTYLSDLPAVSETPLFQAHDSLYRLLAKATARDPADRFISADELRHQLLGVLREVVSDKPDAGAARHSTSSVLFEVPTVSGETLQWSELPGVKVDEGDPQHAWLQTVTVPDPVERLALLDGAPEMSAEVRLSKARAAMQAENFAAVDAEVQALLAEDPWEWRAVWHSGLAALALGDSASAQSQFNAVYGQVPGELAPKLALAAACEQSGEDGIAESLYLTCARTDANYIAPSAFGLSRIRTRRGDVEGAIRALDLVPPTSGAFPRARREKAGILAASGGGLPALSDAMRSIDSITIEPADRARLSVDVLEKALEDVAANGAKPDIAISGIPASEPELRQGLEAAYRNLARFAPDRSARIQLVDRANQVRPWSVR
jgi:serine/threonine-protein kinase PknG